MFDANHLDDVQTVSTILRGSCNDGTKLSNEKGCYKGLFHMWLVRNGITNLLSLPQLKSEVYRVTYDHRWELPVGNYHGSRGNYHYPF